MSGELAGALAERVTLFREGAGRDTIGGPEGGEVVLGEAWAAIVPAGHGADVEGEAAAAMTAWHVTMRPRDVRVGDGVGWLGRRLRVRRIEEDPRTPDRMRLLAEEVRPWG